MASIEDIIKTLSPVLERRGSIRFAYLFGSVAKGEVAPLSDIDVAVYLSDVNHDVVFDVKLSLHGAYAGP